MTPIQKRLILRLVRLDNRCDAIEDAAAESYDRDAAFDGGEFSGPAIARQVLRAQNAEARRLGFASAQLASDVRDLLNVPTVRCAFSAAPWSRS